MNPRLNRREFAWQASTGACGLMAGALLGAEQPVGREHDPSEKRLVQLGLNALARAHEMKYFADGHRGASLISAHLLCAENKLDERARSRMLRDICRIARLPAMARLIQLNNHQVELIVLGLSTRRNYYQAPQYTRNDRHNAKQQALPTAGPRKKDSHLPCKDLSAGA